MTARNITKEGVELIKKPVKELRDKIADQYICSICLKQYDNKESFKNHIKYERRKDKILPKMLEYYELHKLRILKRNTTYYKEYIKTPQGREAKKRSTYNTIAKHPDRYKARYTLRNAIKLGIIKRLPCEICGSPKTHGHHNDYSKPLEVKWLCHKHHCILEGRWISQN